MNQREQFEEFAMSENGLYFNAGALDRGKSEFYIEDVQQLYFTWKSAQAALIPHMEVLMKDIQTIIAFGLFTASPKLQEAIDFIKSATEDVKS